MPWRRVLFMRFFELASSSASVQRMISAATPRAKPALINFTWMFWSASSAATRSAILRMMSGIMEAMLAAENAPFSPALNIAPRVGAPVAGVTEVLGLVPPAWERWSFGLRWTGSNFSVLTPCTCILTMSLVFWLRSTGFLIFRTCALARTWATILASPCPSPAAVASSVHARTCERGTCEATLSTSKPKRVQEGLPTCHVLRARLREEELGLDMLGKKHLEAVPLHARQLVEAPLQRAGLDVDEKAGVEPDDGAHGENPLDYSNIPHRTSDTALTVAVLPGVFAAPDGQNGL